MLNRRNLFCHCLVEDSFPLLDLSIYLLSKYILHNTHVIAITCQQIHANRKYILKIAFWVQLYLSYMLNSITITIFVWHMIYIQSFIHRSLLAI